MPTLKAGRPCWILTEVPVEVCLPPGYSISRNTERNRRGSFVAYDLDPADGVETPYLAELQFFTQTSIQQFTGNCGSENPCFFGDYPDLARYEKQREALKRREPMDGYELDSIGERVFLVSNLPCYGDTCVIREYTTFVGEIKLDVWVVMDDLSQINESDQILNDFSISDLEQER